MIGRRARSLLLAALLAVPGPAAAAMDLLEPVTSRLPDLRARVREAEGAAERGRLLLLVGEHDTARGLVPVLLEGDLEARLVAGEILEAVHDYAGLAPLIDALHAGHADDPDVRRAVYRWWFAVDDLQRLEAALAERADADRLTTADRLAGAELDERLLRFDAARDGYQRALDEAGTPRDRSRALRGLGVVLRRTRQFDASLERLVEALAVSPPDPDLATELAETLIRLGRTEEAIDAAQLAVRIGPYHIRAHYLLGSGYARRDYDQLFTAYPQAFASGDGTGLLAEGDRLFVHREIARARAVYRRLHEAHPDWADVLVRMGSLEYSEGDYAAARAHFARALERCPEYGRAHIGLARSIDAQRLEAGVHHGRYEARFAAAAQPRIPDIERYVINWGALSGRHRKRLALSVAPWKRYIPVLVEAGATLYIKPLHELLSDAPEQDVLRNQRISYDARLWDDVRGCGGYHTVAGIEDVETTIQNGYDTVIHELSHQVHGVLPEDWKRSIQELYRRTKLREASEGDVFLSRYASGSVWEYFAEGANALESPRRDAYDTREIVRERLQEKDQPLRRLVLRIMNHADVEPSYAVAYVGRGDDRLGRGRPEEAFAAYREALARSPGEESATAALLFALTVTGRAGEALAAAREARAKMPESAALALREADARWLAGEGLKSAIRTLRRARRGVRDEQRYQVDLELGDLLLTAGKAAAARTAFGKVLAYQSDNPQGLWGAARAEALRGAWSSAWSHYDSAVRLRTGIVELRADYARDLLRAGEIERAAGQIEAAVLLDPQDPRVLALQAWQLLDSGRATEARAAATRGLELGPWCDLARIVKARAEKTGGDAVAAERTLAPLRERLRDKAPPVYVYRAKWGRYDRVHTLPRVERDLIPDPP